MTSSFAVSSRDDLGEEGEEVFGQVAACGGEAVERFSPEVETGFERARACRLDGTFLAGEHDPAFDDR